MTHLTLRRHTLDLRVGDVFVSLRWAHILWHRGWWGYVDLAAGVWIGREDGRGASVHAGPWFVTGRRDWGRVVAK